MNNIAAHNDRGLKYLQRQLTNRYTHQPVTFKYRNVDVPCIPSHERRGVVVEVGGRAVVVDFSLIARRMYFPTGDSDYHGALDEEWNGGNDLPAPVSGDSITYKDLPYKVLLASLSADGSFYILDFGDTESGT